MKSILGGLFVSIIFLFSTSNSCFSQEIDSKKLQRLVLKDGSELIGTIEKEDSMMIFFKTVGNVSLTIPLEQVQKREKLLGEIIGGKYYPFDPNNSRLLFAPTARPLDSGEGYFSVYEIFFPFLAYGYTKYFVMTGGFSLIPGVETQILYLAPKIIPIQTEKFDLAGGLLYVSIGENIGGGIVYGIGTYGTQRSAVTLGLGWGLSKEGLKNKPIVMVGLETQFSQKNIKLISENWLIPNSNDDIISMGVRFFGRRLAADFGLIYPLGADTEGFPFIPWVGFAYNFGTHEIK